MMDGSVVMHHDEKEAVRSPDDISVRRLKNRERQRRYRARKRHEADLRKASTVDQSSLHYPQNHTEFQSVPVEVEISVNATSPDCLTRVHCLRDWKKDARSAHIHKKQAMSPVGPSNSGTRTPGGSSATSLECGVQADLLSNYSNTTILNNSATHGLQSMRRHWKAEARNKKSSE